MTEKTPLECALEERIEERLDEAKACAIAIRAMVRP